MFGCIGVNSVVLDWVGLAWGEVPSRTLLNFVSVRSSKQVVAVRQPARRLFFDFVLGHPANLLSTDSEIVLQIEEWRQQR